MAKTSKATDKAEKADKPPTEGQESDPKKKRKRSADKGYETYIHKVIKKAAEGKTISSKALEVVNMLICDLEERLSDKAFELTRFQKKSTLAAPHIQTATKLVFPPEMSGQAIVVASDALKKFTA
jgi:histone H3/H4